MPRKSFPLALTQALAVLLCLGPILLAQDAPPPPPPGQTLSPDQLDGLVAPIALYPDPLISQILVASTYPLEIVQAYQWMQRNPGLSGPDLTQAAQQQNWDPSVQALVIFPEVMKRLNEDVTWTTNLGNAFLAQQADVMDAIQRMRQKAQDAGRLASTPQQRVVQTTDSGQRVIEIVPADPEVIYVPVYDPAWIWGPPMWYPYPRWYWGPRPVYGAGIFFGFGGGILVGEAGPWSSTIRSSTATTSTPPGSPMSTEPRCGVTIPSTGRACRTPIAEWPNNTVLPCAKTCGRRKSTTLTRHGMRGPWSGWGTGRSSPAIPGRTAARSAAWKMARPLERIAITGTRAWVLPAPAVAARCGRLPRRAAIPRAAGGDRRQPCEASV